MGLALADGSLPLQPSLERCPERRLHHGGFMNALLLGGITTAGIFSLSHRMIR
jgi:hypothetical protein